MHVFKKALKWCYMQSCDDLLIWIEKANVKFIKYEKIIIESSYSVSQFILWFGTKVIGGNSCQVAQFVCEILIWMM